MPRERRTGHSFLTVNKSACTAKGGLLELRALPAIKIEERGFHRWGNWTRVGDRAAERKSTFHASFFRGTEVPLPPLKRGLPPVDSPCLITGFHRWNNRTRVGERAADRAAER
jgi:hypothetical protein